MTSEKKPILLIGMMGAGKTEIGKALAEKLGRPFFDCDEEIERIAGKSIPEIFAGNGEAAFRALENGVLSGLLGREDVLIAGGGGVFPRPEALNIWLKGDPEVLYQRSAGGDRPKRGSFEDFKKLYEGRIEGYAKAELVVTNDGQSVTETVENILKGLT